MKHNRLQRHTTPAALVALKNAPEGDGQRRAGKWLTRLPRLCLKAPVYAYRYLLSPLLGQNCRFQPTCSAYALEALETHGALKGGWLALRRLLRCHPITWLGGGSGYDPVPPPQRQAEKEAKTGRN